MRTENGNQARERKNLGLIRDLKRTSEDMGPRKNKAPHFALFKRLWGEKTPQLTADDPQNSDVELAKRKKPGKMWKGPLRVKTPQRNHSQKRKTPKTNTHKKKKKERGKHKKATHKKKKRTRPPTKEKTKNNKDRFCEKKRPVNDNIFNDIQKKTFTGKRVTKKKSLKKGSYKGSEKKRQHMTTEERTALCPQSR